MFLALFHTGTGQRLLKKIKLFFIPRSAKILKPQIGNTGKDFLNFLVRLYVISIVIDIFGNDFGHGKEQSDDVILF